MTPPEYLAGRELDLLVRDRVFGPWDESRCHICGWEIVPHGHPGCWTDNCSMRPAPKRAADEPQPYSTEIADAWAVVEKVFRNRGWYLAPTDKGWGVYEGGEWFFIAEAETAPLAICRAALAAVGTP